MNARVWKVASLLFGSGLCALVYQTAWLRELRLIFGASTAASAAVLAIFMGGLGLGSALLGGRADRHPRPLDFYAKLEGLIALSVAFSPALIWAVRHAYILLGGTEALGAWGGTVVRLLLSTLVLAVPTVLMGGTLPAAARTVEDDADVHRRALAVLYGVNTLGALVGAASSTFFLFEAFGTRATLWMACLLNLAVAVIARVVARGLKTAESRMEERAEEQIPSAPSARQAPRTFVLVSAALVGFVFLLMELVWYRMLGPILGGSTFTFGLVLVTALLGMGVGGAAYAVLFRSRPATLSGFALTCALEAAFIALPLALGDRLAHFSLLLRGLGSFGFGGLILAWSAVTVVVVLPAAFVAGVQYPLLIALLGRAGKDVGRQVGHTYAWNTFGSIIGSLAGGFGLIPFLSAPGTWRLVVLVLVTLSAAAMLLALRGADRWRSTLAPALVVVLALLCLTARGPTAVWRHSGIGAGRAPVASTRNGFEALDEAKQQSLLWEADGVESSVGVLLGHGLSFIVNGKSDGSTLGDAGTQVMGGLVGALLHPGPRHALVVGLGTGSTAGWMGLVPGVERVDVVEIEPAIVEVARRAKAVNANVLSNGRVHLILGDAREILLASRERYDVIFSEPSNPYRAGIASLFTREFYEAVGARLSDDGVFIQWLQAYEVDARTVQSVYATLRTAFPSVSTWHTQAGDLLLVATHRPLTLDAAKLKDRVSQEPYRSALRVAWGTTELEGLLAHHLAGPSFTEHVVADSDLLINTDDLNFIEFGFARSVGRDAGFSTGQLANLARALELDRPHVLNGEVNWQRVEEQRLYAMPGLGRRPGMDGESRRGLQSRARTLALLKTNPRAGLQLWRSNPWEPKDYWEHVLLAHALTITRAPEAPTYLESLARFSPTEAALLRAHRESVQGKPQHAVELLEEGFKLLHEDPWVYRAVGLLALETARNMARKDKELGQRLFAVLGTPFAGYAFEDARRSSRISIAESVDRAGLCVEALDAVEPHPSWNRETLEWRARCYAQSNHPKLDEAMEDLLRFLSEEPPAFLPEVVQQVVQDQMESAEQSEQTVPSEPTSATAPVP